MKLKAEDFAAVVAFVKYKTQAAYKRGLRDAPKTNVVKDTRVSELRKHAKREGCYVRIPIEAWRKVMT